MSISLLSSSSLDSLFIWCLITKSAVSKGYWCHSWLCLFILCCSIHKSEQIDFSCFKKCMVIFLDSIKCTENISMKKLVSAVALILVFCRIKYFISLNGHYHGFYFVARLVLETILIPTKQYDFIITQTCLFNDRFCSRCHYGHKVKTTIQTIKWYTSTWYDNTLCISTHACFLLQVLSVWHFDNYA